MAGFPSGGGPVRPPPAAHHRVVRAVFQFDREVGPDQVGDAEVDGGGYAVVAVGEPGLVVVGADHDGEGDVVGADLVQQAGVVLGRPLVVEDVANVEGVGGVIVVGGEHVEDGRGGDDAEHAGVSCQTKMNELNRTYHTLARPVS